MISYFTSKAEQKSISQKKTNKKEPYNNSSDTQERAELATALKLNYYSRFIKGSQQRLSFSVPGFPKFIKCNVTYNVTTNAKSNVNCSISYILFYNLYYNNTVYYKPIQ